VDPRPHKAELIGQPHKDVEYLVASVCHQDVFDLLEGYNVKLWHVYSHEVGRNHVTINFPRGEWLVTGGANVGMRSMVLSRFLGFKKMTIFGMDYSFKNDGTQHAGWHPNEHPKAYAVDVNGEIFYTNGAMHQYAQQFFDEVQKIGDVEVEVAGHGLLQAKIREHLKTKPLIPRGTKPVGIAAMLPNVITPEYSALNKQLHESDPSYGTSGSKRADIVRKLIEKTKPASILDYGAGKGTLAAALPMPIWEYDPCILGKDQPPRAAELVVCTDVLEHVEPNCLDSVLLDLRRVTLKVCYVVIHTGPAIKSLPDGRNAHLIQQPMEWWNQKLENFFRVASINQAGVEVTAILGPKEKEKESTATAPPLDYSKRITPARHDGTEVKFYTPNDQTHWRARTLFTKEPVTIEWIDTFKLGEVFFDVGANVGGYSVWAAKRRGVKVFAFEPESGNYALLCRNFVLNEVNGLAYCCALYDKNRMSVINLSSQETGGGCNTFDQVLGPERKTIPQGCFGYELDTIIKTLGQPDHIKIDVDGLEPLVISGGVDTIKNCKSLLVEVNPNLPEHKRMVHTMEHLGFEFDPAQVEKSTRKEGNFKGVAEYVFRKKGEMLVTLPNEIRTDPFKWLYAENVFPADIYQQMIASFPSEYTPIEQSRNLKGYPERFTAIPTDGFWKDIFDRLRDGRLKRQMCELFGVANPDQYEDECLLVRDLPGYGILPHTDHKVKVITVLFYLPKQEICNAGTRIYEPKKSGFTCDGSGLYPLHKFRCREVMPFKPNSMFAFLKTNNSFHGVEKCDATRDVLLYDIRHRRKK
jgi:FkbM family methyltransferase